MTRWRIAAAIGVVLIVASQALPASRDYLGIVGVAMVAIVAPIFWLLERRAP